MNLPAPDRDKYLLANPFPHCVIEDVFEKGLVDMLLEEWPLIFPLSDKNHKLRGGTTNQKAFGWYISNFVNCYFHSQKFIMFLEELTGIKGLVLDCQEIGLHEIFTGGSLASHLDYTINKRTGLQHRANAILFLNKDWKPDYNGCLEFFENGKVAAAIPPLFNSIAIFTISENAWHGVTKPVSCPPNMSRKSISFNYFTAPKTGAKDIPTTYKTKLSLKDFVPPIIFRLKNFIK